MSAPRTEPDHILMIDDDVELSSLLSEYLGKYGYRITTAHTVSEGRKQLRGREFDLLILDLMLPDGDGLTLCREIRHDRDIPIVMLTARGEVADRVVGLELGADDYLAKPFEPRELVARIDSVLRRSKMRVSGRELVSGGLRLEPETRRVTLDGQALELTTMEFELLRILMESGGRVMSRDRLLDKVRGVDACEVFDRSIDMLVSRVRQKLGDDSRSPRFIKTIWRTGYQFIGADDE